jgi:hypothetical protein
LKFEFEKFGEEEEEEDLCSSGEFCGADCLVVKIETINGFFFN